MAKGDKVFDKVVAERLKDRTATQREIAEKVGTSQSTVDRAEKKMGKIGSKYPAIESFIENDMEVLKLGQKELIDRLEDEKQRKSIPHGELNRITDSAQKRYALFKGDVTDEDGGLKNDAKSMSIEELLKLAQD